MSKGKKIQIILNENNNNIKKEINYTPLSYDELKNYIYKIFNLENLYDKNILKIYAILFNKDVKIEINEVNIKIINDDLNNLKEFYIEIEKKNKNLNKTDIIGKNYNIEFNQINLKQILNEFKNEIISNLTNHIFDIVNNKFNEDKVKKKLNNENENNQLILQYLDSNYNAILEIKNNIKSLSDKMFKIENDINNINLNLKNEVKDINPNETSLNNNLIKNENISKSTINNEILKPGISVDFTNETSDISLYDLALNKAFMKIKIKNNGEKIWPNDLYLINYHKNKISKCLYFDPILINDGISVAPLQEFNINIKIEKNSANYFNLTEYTFPFAIMDKNKKLLVEEIGNKKISFVENLSKLYDIEERKKVLNNLSIRNKNLDNNFLNINNKDNKENENFEKIIKNNFNNNINNINNENKLAYLNNENNLNNKIENNQQLKSENEKFNSNFKNNFEYENEKNDNIKNKINDVSKKQDINNLCIELKHETGNLFTIEQIKESLIKNKFDKEKAKSYLYSISIVI